MNKIATAMRSCLTERAEELQRILDVGIYDVDCYRNAVECFVLLSSIDDDERNPNEVSQRKLLLHLIYSYEDKHYKYGN